ncbi:Exc2 family lipoprotein [Cronobacter sakazakii]|uniref:Exc2 family lipoprotein n=1 Tax=Cronobacter sakazakii TaxID=28141 RepID=UPI001A301196|nr:Exc2 family lipoprotein [Cronobacter sakazakii]MDI7565785.1 Exc2 family lipoprotein [Cronobacter sakazakii]MDI7567003.1 Exc2 family lipoprotein [Cronobacter sakazakii]MDI7572210.1 Exc2 family lipoprotein [Cronobacter sakazakii]MDI7576850.1 Exc2 family lipoprotein [Cronobacter sakazakii]
MRRYGMVVVAVATLLAGCTARTSPEMHARHYVLQGMESHDANLRVDKAGSIAAFLPAFTSVYNQGKTDKAQGRDIAWAERQAKAYRDDAYGMQTTSEFANHRGQFLDDNTSPREKRMLGDDLAQTYLDGFYGR